MLNLTKCLELTIAARTESWKLIELEEIIKAEMLLEEATKKGNKCRYKACLGYIKKSRKNNNLNKSGLDGAWIYNDKQYICNSYSLIQLDTPIPELPESTSQNINLHNCMPELKHFIKLNEKIDLVALRVQLKESKIKGSYVSDIFQLSEAQLSIPLFLEIVDILGTDFEVYQNENSALGPTLIKSGEDLALILPIRTPKKEED